MKTAAYNLTPGQLEALEASLDLAGQFLSDWKETAEDDNAPESLAEHAKAYGRYVAACEAFDIEPWE